eukprot:9491947-Pyramimonas_sp.AAC.3
MEKWHTSRAVCTGRLMLGAAFASCCPSPPSDIHAPVKSSPLLTLLNTRSWLPLFSSFPSAGLSCSKDERSEFDKREVPVGNPKSGWCAELIARAARIHRCSRMMQLLCVETRQLMRRLGERFSEFVDKSHHNSHHQESHVISHLLRGTKSLRQWITLPGTPAGTLVT